MIFRQSSRLLLLGQLPDAESVRVLEHGCICGCHDDARLQCVFCLFLCHGGLLVSCLSAEGSAKEALCATPEHSQATRSRIALCPCS